MNEPSSYEPLILWVTGRAASGKSTFSSLSEEECRNAGIEVQSFCDEALLFQIIDEDTGHEHHYHPHDDDRFLLKTNYPFDEGIRRISAAIQHLLNTPQEKPIAAIIELARGRCHGVMDFSFARAFSLIHPQVIERSNFFYLQSTWDDQIERNRAREADGKPHPPESMMKDLYSEDDFESARSVVPFEIIENNGDLDSFQKAIRSRLQTIISNYKRSLLPGGENISERNLL